VSTNSDPQQKAPLIAGLFIVYKIIWVARSLDFEIQENTLKANS